MQPTRKARVDFTVGEVDLRIDVHGELFGCEEIGPVLEELLAWTKGSIEDNLVPYLVDNIKDLNLRSRETVAESFARLTLDGNSFDISVEVLVPYQIEEATLKAAIINTVTGDSLGQFADLVRTKLAEGSLPDAGRFRKLMAV